jgi:hypothetical protein
MNTCTVVVVTGPTSAGAGARARPGEGPASRGDAIGDRGGPGDRAEARHARRLEADLAGAPVRTD